MADSEHTTFTISPPPPPPPPPSTSTSDQNLKRMGIPDTHADFKQWLHAMKMVARLPGGMPAEFRRKVSTIDLTYLHLNQTLLQFNDEKAFDINFQHYWKWKMKSSRHPCSPAAHTLVLPPLFHYQRDIKSVFNGEEHS